MARVVLAGMLLVGLSAVLATVADVIGPWGQFAAGMAIMFAVSFVLPHYFYRGEPLLPDRRKRR